MSRFGDALDNFGVGITLVTFGTGLWFLSYAAVGFQKFGTLTGFGKIGVAVVTLAAVSMLTVAGYVYSVTDSESWTNLIGGVDE